MSGFMIQLMGSSALAGTPAEPPSANPLSVTQSPTTSVGVRNYFGIPASWTDNLTVTATGGTGSYTYAWSSNCGTFTSGLGTNTVAHSVPYDSGGEYTGTVTCVVSSGQEMAVVTFPVHLSVESRV